MSAQPVPLDDAYEAVFRWPHSSSNNVILTGTFDQWSRSMTLTNGPSGFEGRVRVPWGTKVLYKFIVDGNWTTVDGQPTEQDSAGHWNNVFNAPPQPEPPLLLETESAAAESPNPSPVDSETKPSPDTFLQVPTDPQPTSAVATYQIDGAPVDSPHIDTVPPQIIISDSQSPAAPESPTSPAPPIAIVPPTPAPPHTLPLPDVGDDAPRLPVPDPWPEPPTTTTVPVPDQSKKGVPNSPTTDTLTAPAAALTPTSPTPPTPTHSTTIGKKTGRFKFGKQPFPSSSAGEDPSSSPTTVSHTGSFRAMRHSIVVKLKDIFTHDGKRNDDDNKRQKHKRASSFAK